MCPKYCPKYAYFGQVLLDEAVRFRADFEASLIMATTFKEGKPWFIPPIAQLNYPPNTYMTDGWVSMYSNFRYYAELLGADILTSDFSFALQEFRENHGGTVSGTTRWSDHLDGKLKKNAV